jgi:SAM-dependent methyltransferase
VVVRVTGSTIAWLVVMLSGGMAETWAMPTGSGDRWPEDYERGRPGWPPEVVGLPGLPPTATVLDLGAGTGKLTRLLVPAFRRVIAVEPADAMRRVLETICPEAEALPGTGQEIPLAEASVDAVFAAQSFHWFEDERAVAEIARVLRPGGAVALMFNAPAGSWEPSAAPAEKLLTERGPTEVSYIPLDLGAPDYAADDGPFAVPGFEALKETRLQNPQTLDREGLVAFYASMGWVGDLPDSERMPLLDDVRSLLAAPVYRRLWETRVYWTRRGA